VRTYRFDPGLAFPELYAGSQDTRNAEHPIAALTTLVAFLLHGQHLPGSQADLTPEQLYKEISDACDELHVPVERLFRWAQSLLIPPDETLPEEDARVRIPYRLVGPNFVLHPYQRRIASWAAHRMGSVHALGCGVGKTGTASAASIGAVLTGKASRERCFIICPLNACGTWRTYLEDLQRVFKQVVIYSVDSLHHLENLSPHEGGVIIFDEVHKLKNEEADRTDLAHLLRRKFEWACCLTGTLLHTGPEALISIQNLACPGLSRHMDKWALGEQLGVICEKKVRGRGTLRSLGIPTSSTRPILVQYLRRSTQSLSNESPEVADIFNVPGQTRFIVDSWPRPSWLSEADLWPPELNIPQLLGATAIAEFNQNRAKLVEEVNRRFNASYTDPVLAAQRATEEFEKHKAEVAISEEAVQVDETLGELPKLAGFPTFPATFWATRQDGLYNRALVEIDEDGVITYRYRYGPGDGPKLLWLEQWLDDNGDEPILVGAVTVPTLDAVVRLLTRKGIDYRLIRGGVPARQREKAKNEFQAGQFRVMLVQQIAGSESITLTRAATSILLDHDLSPITYTQFLGRTARQGQDRECQHYDLAFNLIQQDRILALRRGEDFDAETRRELENAYNQVTQSQSQRRDLAGIPAEYANHGR
jgi:hypothetical protein